MGGLDEQTFNVWEPYRVKPDVPVFVADFCLSALLRDNATLDRLRAEAEDLSTDGSPPAAFEAKRGL